MIHLPRQFVRVSPPLISGQVEPEVVSIAIDGARASLAPGSCGPAAQDDGRTAVPVHAFSSASMGFENAASTAAEVTPSTPVRKKKYPVDIAVYNAPRAP